MDKSLRVGSALLRRASRDAAAASRWSVPSASAMGAPPGNPTFATGSRCLASLASSSREWRSPPPDSPPPVPRVVWRPRAAPR